MSSSHPSKSGQGTPRIVVAGAGHASLIALQRLCGRQRPDADITLVTGAAEAHYSGMVPGWIEGLYTHADMTIPLAPAATRWGVRLKVANIIGATEDTLQTDDGPVPFDLLVVNTGADALRPPPLNVPSVIPAKPFARLIEGLAPQFETAATFAVIGGGVAGVEVALALATRRPGAGITLVERGPHLAPSLPRRAGERIARHLTRRGVTVALGEAVAEVGNGNILVGGREIAADVCLAFTGAEPQRWLANTPFARHTDGFLATAPTLQSLSHANVLVGGDAGTRVADPRPKAGVFSVRTGPLLAAAMKRWLNGQPLQPAPLQRRSLVLVSTGERSAIGTRNGVVMEGAWVWRWKNHLDRAFVDQFKR